MDELRWIAWATVAGLLVGTRVWALVRYFRDRPCPGPGERPDDDVSGRGAG